MITNEYVELNEYTKEKVLRGNVSKEDLKIKFFTNFTFNYSSQLAYIEFKLVNEITDKELFALQFNYPELVKMYKWYVGYAAVNASFSVQI